MYSNNELLKRSIRNSIDYEKAWLLAMEKCDTEEDIEAKEESKKFIKASIKYYEKRWGERI